MKITTKLQYVDDKTIKQAKNHFYENRVPNQKIDKPMESVNTISAITVSTTTPQVSETYSPSLFPSSQKTDRTATPPSPKKITGYRSFCNG
jgi:hypothetical protein